MVNVNLLKAEIVKAGLSVESVYKGIGLTKKQWYDRIQKGVFNSDEMYDLVKFIGIEEPIPIFFAEKVT